MNRKKHWRAKLMACMARDGDVESLAEMITELMETPDRTMTAPAVPAGPIIAAPAAQPLQAGSAMDPVVAAVVQAIEGPMEAAPVVATPVAAPVAVAPEAPVDISAPADQPVLVDCGPDILAALNRIPLLSPYPFPSFFSFSLSSSLPAAPIRGREGRKREEPLRLNTRS